MPARNTAVALAFALLAGLAPLAAASGIDLARAKGMGAVGERIDGYVGVVTAQSSAPIEAVVKRINARRRELYEQVAQKNGTGVGVVEVLAGERLIARASRREWVTDADGVWRRK